MKKLFDYSNQAARYECKCGTAFLFVKDKRNSEDGEPKCPACHHTEAIPKQHYDRNKLRFYMLRGIYCKDDGELETVAVSVGRCYDPREFMSRSIYAIPDAVADRFIGYTALEITQDQFEAAGLTFLIAGL